MSNLPIVRKGKCSEFHTVFASLKMWLKLEDPCIDGCVTDFSVMKSAGWLSSIRTPFMGSDACLSSSLKEKLPLINFCVAQPNGNHETFFEEIAFSSILGHLMDGISTIEKMSWAPIRVSRSGWAIAKSNWWNRASGKAWRKNMIDLGSKFHIILGSSSTCMSPKLRQSSPISKTMQKT